MKLRSRYNYVILVTTTIVMLATGVIYYQAISWILTYQKDKDLMVEEQETFDYVRLNHELPKPFEYNDQQITFSVAKPGSVKREFIDTKYFEKWDDDNPHRRHHHHNSTGEYESGRGLVTSVTVGNTYYRVLIVESTVETEYLIRLIFTITICVMLAVLIVLLLINRLILSRLWQPFYTLLSGLRAFRVADNNEIPASETNIDEFSELNRTVAEMTSRAKTDYKELKTFTENASHELLTPIAVINSKLDSLIQTENFNERQSKLLNDLYTAVSRLSRLNQSMLLLAKIENRLLHEQTKINLKEMLEETLAQFEEIFQDKQISIKDSLAPKAVRVNPYLAEVLINNLVGNAIRHNYKGGEIIISLTNDQLSIRNTGDNDALDGEKIFNRFHKTPESEGTGLGLTISKQICESFGFRLGYSFDEGYHIFTVEF